MSDFLFVMTHGGLLVVCLLLIVTTEVIAERKLRSRLDARRPPPAA